ncbi:MAG TPA: SatD family protein, partial [Niastella sp.]
QNKLMKSFKKITDEINYEKKDILLSPIAITLGDEFQCVVKNVEAGIELMLAIDEKKLYEMADFKLRYVLVEGGIETPINHDIAYGMLGEGLTIAREKLIEYKNSYRRYSIQLNNIRKSEALANSLIVYQNIIDTWKMEKDYLLIARFLELKDYKLVADEMGKTRSQIWKREKSLNLEAYFSIKQVINYIAETT